MNQPQQSTGYTPAFRGGGPSGTRHKVTFETNAPVAVTIERDPPDFPVEGSWGPQYMYFLAGNQIMYVEPAVHEALLARGVSHGKTYTITKTKIGRSNKWLVHGGDLARAAEAALNPPPALTPEQRQAALRAAQPAAAPAAAAAAPKERKTQPMPDNLMATALIGAIEATQKAEAHAEATGANFRATSEDIRALAITMYITLTGGRAK